MTYARFTRVSVSALALVTALICLAITALALGSADLSLAQVIEVIARRVGLVQGESVSVLADRIVWDLRLPRVLGAACVGASLAVCGVILQSLTRNELADPYLLGISSGASVGAVSVIVFGLSVPFFPEHLTITIAAFIGAIVALVVVLILATGRSGALPPGRTILAGVAIGQLCSAFTSMSIMVFGERGQARDVMAWTLGSLAGLRWQNTTVLVISTLVCVGALVVATQTLDAFAFGETSASALGVNVNLARWALMGVTALITAITVAIVGPIGFIGLTVPHLVRLATGPNHVTLLPLSAIAGATLLLAADTLARTLQPGSEIPIGVVTAAIGAPVLVFLLRRQAVAT